jgi:predicted aminopeptidase
MAHKAFKYLAIGLTAVQLAGCGTLHYLNQAANGEAAVLKQARPMQEVIADPATAPSLSEKLKLAQRIRAFAVNELKLPDNASYTRYAELGREYVLWNVVSTPALSLHPVENCFPIVGCISYRGYYQEGEARQYADARRGQGEDVFMYGIPAYSTLGWFNDPLLSSTVRYGELALARLIFHELTHQLIYVQNDSSFNEALATAVEQEGIERWLEYEGKPALIARYRESEARQKAFDALMNEGRQQLAKVYASAEAQDAKLSAKVAVLGDLRQRYLALKQSWGGYAGFDGWFEPLPNNAHLASLSTYHAKVPALRELFRQQGSDFVAFYAAARALAAKPRPERDTAIEALAQDAREYADKGVLAVRHHP